jgi:chemotaxis protein MotB
MSGKGGAWKVAFADFMTAMMAFFMVMWLTAQDKEILISTASYFQTPFKSPMTAKAGVLNSEAQSAIKSNSGGTKSEDGGVGTSTSAQTVDLAFLNSVAKDVFKLLNMDDNLANKPLDVQVTSDGLRITIYDRRSQPFFVDNTAKFTPWGDFVMQSLAWTADRNHFNIVIEGHTRTGLNFSNPDYGDWELSSDRANAARRALVRYAVAPDKIERVTGYANTRPVPLELPTSETNQRITMSLRVGKTKSSQPPPKSATAAPPPDSALPLPKVTSHGQSARPEPK